MSDPYARGDQPCKAFDPGTESQGGGCYNYHECPHTGCDGSRRFCQKCLTDHHEGGWDTCARNQECLVCHGSGENPVHPDNPSAGACPGCAFEQQRGLG